MVGGIIPLRRATSSRYDGRLGQESAIAMADSWIRRKITLVSQSKILDIVETKTIKDAAAQCNISVSTKVVDDREIIVLPTTKAELKKLLRFLDEDYFHSSLQNLAHMTNSKRRA
jgi:hypothetical protein